ncbi:hypothetical protein GW17_00042901 [Ensete ventricosum]|nr:hypothetical protein GW17_00042901 [Ensete ventricosum]
MPAGSRPFAGWPRASAAPTALPRASSPLLAGRWQRAVLLSTSSLPTGATPVAGRQLAGYCPCGWQHLAGGPWLQPVGHCSRPGHGFLALHGVARPGGLAVAGRPSSSRPLL